MQETETDVAMLIGARTASHVLETRERRRRENDGFLVPPPIPLSEMASARLVDPAPGSTTMRPNAALVAVSSWLHAIFEAGGNADDLRQAWLAWPTQYPAHLAKAPLTNEFEALTRRARAREVELSSKADRETQPERTLALARAQLANAEHRVVMMRAAHKRATATIELVKQATGAVSFNRELFIAQAAARDAKDDLTNAEVRVAECKHQLEAAERAVEVRP